MAYRHPYALRLVRTGLGAVSISVLGGFTLAACSDQGDGTATNALVPSGSGTSEDVAPSGNGTGPSVPGMSSGSPNDPSTPPTDPLTPPPATNTMTPGAGAAPSPPATNTAPAPTDPDPIPMGTGGSPELPEGAGGNLTPADGTAGVPTIPEGNGGSLAGAGGTPPGPVGGYPEDTTADCDVSAGELFENEMLPDPFAMNDGTPVTTKAEWTCRRAEIIADIEEYEIGPKPPPPQVEASVSGDTLDVVVTTDDGSITLSSSIGSAQGEGPHCVAIGMNGDSSLIDGCVQVPFMHDQVVGYNNGGGTQNNSDPFYEVYPELWGEIGNYAAWSWGISRIIDGLEQVKDELNIDTTRIGVHGCSYAGKMALFGGAFDERVALTVAQESGGGGITSWRTSQNFSTRTGIDIEKIDNTNSAWFKPSMQQLDPYSLPHDHHELIAMIAPRAVIALGNQDFDWLGDESGWKSMNAAKEVWKAMGVPDAIGFDFTSNHGHCAAPASQVASVNAFVDRFLKGESVDTEVAIDPQEGDFDLDTSNVIDWETPTLQ